MCGLQTGEVLKQVKLHEDKINGVSFDKAKVLFVSYSVDTYAKLVDAKTLGKATPELRGGTTVLLIR
jgi:hypothetical protein